MKINITEIQNISSLLQVAKYVLEMSARKGIITGLQSSNDIEISALSSKELHEKFENALKEISNSQFQISMLKKRIEHELYVSYEKENNMNFISSICRKHYDM